MPWNCLKLFSIQLQLGLFDKEYLAYGIIFPLITKERTNKNLDNLAVPRCFYVHPDPGVLVMNNLKEIGFDLVKNKPNGIQKGLQGQEIILFMKKLANFHASTHHLVQETGGMEIFLEKYPCLRKNNPPNKDVLTVFKQSFLGSMDNAVDIAKDYINAEVSEKMKKITNAFEIFMKYFFDPYVNKNDGYQTIIHGDGWQNNAMFR